MKLETTERGFAISSFIDKYGAKCSIQKSSLATEDCLWLGIDVDIDGNAVSGGRMHLTQEQVQELIPLLMGFVTTGELVPIADETAVMSMLERMKELEVTLKNIRKLTDTVVSE
jgi:hypothetical protein